MGLHPVEHTGDVEKVLCLIVRIPAAAKAQIGNGSRDKEQIACRDDKEDCGNELCHALKQTIHLLRHIVADPKEDKSDHQEDQIELGFSLSPLLSLQEGQRGLGADLHTIEEEEEQHKDDFGQKATLQGMEGEAIVHQFHAGVPEH